MEKIKEMVEAYNKKANKWGFGEIEIIDGKISKEFTEKSTKGKGLFGSINILYQNGYMKEDYEKIKKALPQVTPMKVETPIEKKVEVKHEKSIEEQALANTFKK
jgi:phosphosulfolactate synthase (CoM biosynthesis protein A)